MSYRYNGGSAVQEHEAHIRAKFEYFRKSESGIDLGPAPAVYEPVPIRFRGEVAECGTHSGYKAHIVNKTKPCQKCREARAIYQREYRRKKREMAA
jgi:hypothetical protein